MMTISETLAKIGESYAAGLFLCESRSLYYRHCAGYAAYFDAFKLPEYHGEPLYPCGGQWLWTDVLTHPEYAMTYTYSGAMLRDRFAERRASDPAAACITDADMENAIAAMDAFWAENGFPGGWLHGCPNYHRVINEGLASYRARALATKGDADFRDGTVLLLDAIERLLARIHVYLCDIGAPAALCDAIARVPLYPARTYYEGLVSWNMVYYLDGCDNLGCIDRGLAHLYDGTDLTHVIAQLFENVNQTERWSCTLGPDYNEITAQALRAIKGKRRPLLELRTTPEMPEELWQIASDMLCSGATNPSFYNDRGIHDMIAYHLPQIPDDELALFCGCGCTETNLEGLTRAGGTDDDLNLLLLLEQYMKAHLTTVSSFEEFYEGLIAHTCNATNRMLDGLSARYHYMAEHLPNPMRSILTDDCIDKGLDYNAGGARYTWTMNADAGLINVIDSLWAIKTLVFDEKRYTAEEFLSNLAKEDDAFIAILKACPCFGLDDPNVDALAKDYTTRIYSVYKNRPKDDFIDAFTLTEHQFMRYEPDGRAVGPTPDGRRAGEPTCDSVAALRGKAKKGPTAMLSSAAGLPQHLAMGMTVLNLTISKRVAENPAMLRALIDGYFEKGGLQVQVTVTSPEELLDALAHPDRHADMIVRVGGYSEYFGRLSPALQKAVVERDVHNL